MVYEKTRKGRTVIQRKRVLWSWLGCGILGVILDGLGCFCVLRFVTWGMLVRTYLMIDLWRDIQDNEKICRSRFHFHGGVVWVVPIVGHVARLQ